MLAGALGAQPTITIADAPVPGDHVEYHFAMHGADGTAGPDQVWVFDGPWDAPVPFDFMDPSELVDGPAITGATLVAVDNLGHTVQYYTTANSALEVVGGYDQLNQETVWYVDPALTIPYPCTYGSAWTDTVSITYQEGGGPNEEVANDCVVDGYGTLIAPYGSLSDVIKVHCTRTNEWTEAGYVYREEHNWNRFWKPGFPFYVAEMNYGIYYLNDEFVASDSSIMLISDLTLGLAPFLDHAEAFTVGHANGRLTLLRSSSDPATLILLNTIGQEVMRQRIPSGAQRLELDVSPLPAGTYIVRIAGLDASACSKFVLE